MREVESETMLAFVLKAVGAGLAFGFNVAVALLRFVATHTLRVDASQAGVLPRNAVLWNDTMLSVASQIDVFRITQPRF